MPSMAIDLYLEPESDVDRPRLVDVWAESAIGVRLPVSSAGTVDLASPTRPAFVDVDRPGPASGVCPPASTLSASAAGPAQPRVVDVGRLGMYVRRPGLVLRGDSRVMLV